MHLVAAPDKFRGTATANRAAAAIAAGAEVAGWSCRELPLADGGEGTLDALGGANMATTVTGPQGEPVRAPWRLDGETAVIEMARASGLDLAGGKEGNNALLATTRGTGELIAAAIEAGARNILVGVGGSATTDGGHGALEALSMIPFQAHGALVEVACDVQTTFIDAASVFGPQKGASNDQVAALTVRLAMLAAHYEQELGVDVTEIPGSGGAGGLAGGLAALGAKLAPGFDLIADRVGLDDALDSSQLVITGEGAFDRTSLMGKVVGGVLKRATERHLPAAAIVGEALARSPRPLTVVSLVQQYGRGRAMADTELCIAEATTALLTGRRWDGVPTERLNPREGV